MTTLVTFHAHPDDEAIATAGVMARAVGEGRRVVLVLATRGEVGEVADGFLAPGESLAERRVAETHAAAEIIGVHRVAFLGYADSGLLPPGEAPPPGSFAAADVEEAAARLAALLREEQADVLTVYDDNGGYGHPDHIQVHRVGVRAAELAGTPRVCESTVDRDYMRQVVAESQARGEADLPDPVDIETLGVPGHRITTVVDVRPWLEVKRAAMRAHASQITEDSFFLALSPEAFALTFGQEAFIRRDAPPGTRETDLFAGL